MKLPNESKQEIVNAYRDGLDGRKLRVAEIAQVFGTSASTVSQLAKRAGLTRNQYACVVDCEGSYGNRRQHVQRVGAARGKGKW